MSDDFTVDVKVDGRLLQVLNFGFHDSINNVLKDTGNEATKIMVKEAPYKTGNLRRSLDPEFFDLIAQVKTKDINGATVAEYWKYQQYGTSKIPPNPFVTRTVETVQNNKVFERATMKELKRLGLK